METQKPKGMKIIWVGNILGHKLAVLFKLKIFLLYLFFFIHWIIWSEFVFLVLIICAISDTQNTQNLCHLKMRHNFSNYFQSHMKIWKFGIAVSSCNLSPALLLLLLFFSHYYYSLSPLLRGDCSSQGKKFRWYWKISLLLLLNSSGSPEEQIWFVSRSEAWHEVNFGVQRVLKCFKEHSGFNIIS